MKKIETIAEGINYDAVNIGSWDEVIAYELPMGPNVLLDSKDGNLYESTLELEALGQKLLNKYPDTVFYTGHCTGDAAYKILKGVMGDQIKSFSTGMQILL